MDLGFFATSLTGWELAYILVAGLATAVLHTLAGFAGGILLSILVAPVVGVTGVVPVMTVALLISAISRLWVFWRVIDWDAYLRLMVTGLPGIVLGAIVYGFLPPRAVAAVLGVFLIGSVVFRHTLERRKIEVTRRAFPAVGAVFGLLSGGTVGAGMILVPFMVGAGIVGERIGGMFASIGFTLNVVKAAVFIPSSVLDVEHAVIGAVLGLSTMPGTMTGYWLLRRTPVRVHIAMVEALVVAGGGFFLVQAVGWV